MRESCSVDLQCGNDLVCRPPSPGAGSQCLPLGLDTEGCNEPDDCASQLCLVEVNLCVANRPPQLLVRNQTAAEITIEVWSYDEIWKWLKVAKVSPGTQVPITNIVQSTKFRALGAWGEPQYHTVTLRLDEEYEGLLDLWPLK